MTVTTFYVASGYYDYYNSSSSGIIRNTTTIRAEHNNFIYPNYDSTAYADVDTSSLGTDTISAATLYYDIGTVSKSKGVTATYYLYMYTGSGWSLIRTDTATTGVKSLVLNSTQRGYINKTGDTRFRVTCIDPGAFKGLLINFKAYETAQANAFRLSITHTAASSYKPQVNVISS